MPVSLALELGRGTDIIQTVSAGGSAAGDHGSLDLSLYRNWPQTARGFTENFIAQHSQLKS